MWLLTLLQPQKGQQRRQKSSELHPQGCALRAVLTVACTRLQFGSVTESTRGKENQLGGDMYDAEGS